MTTATALGFDDPQYLVDMWQLRWMPRMKAGA